MFSKKPFRCSIEHPLHMFDDEVWPLVGEIVFGSALFIFSREQNFTIERAVEFTAFDAYFPVDDHMFDSRAVLMGVDVSRLVTHGFRIKKII